MTALVADFRSDTVTKPTEAMLKAMASAEVGDDVLGDDPTVRRLEERAASLLGKEAGLFVPSGTMGNQCSIAAQTQPGDEIIIERDAHVFLWESGGLARVPAVQPRSLVGRGGALDPAEVEAAIRPANVHVPRTSLICLEQTHLSSGGRVVPLAVFEAIRAVASRHGVRIHCDGARLFNACVASGVAASAYAKYCDSVTFCLSKGLSCPVGSLIVGERAFIDRCRHVRKWMGGAMRQSGYLAACGLGALDSMIDRLAEDHATARSLAKRLAELGSLQINPDDVETNIVFVGTRGRSAGELSAALAARGVGALPMGPTTLRFVTHRHVGQTQVELAVSAAASILSA